MFRAVQKAMSYEHLRDSAQANITRGKGDILETFLYFTMLQSYLMFQCKLTKSKKL